MIDLHLHTTASDGCLSPEALVAAGRDATEVYHSDHTPEVTRDLQQFAAEHRLLVSGGSDFHGDNSRDRPLAFATLPAVEFERLRNAR